MISYFSWSRGFDPGDFIIYFPKTHDPVISLTEIPWCADLWIEGGGCYFGRIIRYQKTHCT